MTASTAAEILGFGRGESRTPLDAWMSIRGDKEEMHEGNERLEAGNIFEEPIAKWWAKRTARELLPSPGFIEHPTLPWLAGTPDFMFAAGDDIGVLEVKNRDRFAEGDWLAGAPPEEAIQLQLYLAICDLQHGSFGVCFGGNKLITLDVVRDDVFLSAAIEQLAQWYETHVLGDTPPPMTACERDVKLWKRLHPRDNGMRVVASEEAIMAASIYRDATARISELEKSKTAAQAVLLREIDDNTYLALPDGSGFTCKTQVSNFQAQEARTVETRVLRSVKKV